MLYFTTPREQAYFTYVELNKNGYMEYFTFPNLNEEKRLVDSYLT
jgi:hypothetical protein